MSEKRTTERSKNGPKTLPPDGEPKQRTRDRDSTMKSKVSEVQDPLIAGGAETALCAANPLSTRDDVAGGLVDRHGAVVQARRGGDAGKPGVRVEAKEAKVDEAGQLRRKKGEVDLLH